MDLRNLEEENDEFSERRKFQQPLRSEREARAAEERKESRGGGKDLELGIAEHASG